MTMFANHLLHTYMTTRLAGSDGVVLDLGASTADFSAHIVGLYDLDCLAFEAHPGKLERMASHPRISLFNRLVSGTDDEQRNVAEQDNGFVWVSELETELGGETARSVNVASINLAGILALVGDRPVALAKVDIEGSEFAFFEAATDAEILRVEQFTVEFHDFLDPALSPAVDAVRRRLEGLGYQWMKFTRHTNGDVLAVRADCLPAGWKLRYLFEKYRSGLSRILQRMAGKTA